MSKARMVPEKARLGPRSFGALLFLVPTVVACSSPVVAVGADQLAAPSDGSTGGAAQNGADGQASDDFRLPAGPCNPLQPIGPVSVGTAAVAGKAIDGTVYVVTDLNKAPLYVFVSRDGTLYRQPPSGGAQGGTSSYFFTFSEYTPQFSLQVDVSADGGIAMGVVPGIRQGFFQVGQEGETLALLTAAEFASMPARDEHTPYAPDYCATLGDGRELVVLQNYDPGSGGEGFEYRIYVGTPDKMVERALIGGTTKCFDCENPVIKFDLDGAPATLTYYDSVADTLSNSAGVTLTRGCGPLETYSYVCLAQ